MPNLEKQRMKRYQQLCLVLLAVISFTLLLVYERKYSRIKLVLQYMDVIGSKPDIEDCKILLENSTLLRPVKTSPTTYGDTGVPTWREVVKDHFIYSAFWDDKNKEVKAVGITRNFTQSDLNCFLWYWDHKQPLAGKISFVFDRSGPTAVTLLSCSYLLKNSIPYGVSFGKKTENGGNLVMIQVVSQKTLSTVSKQVSACVNALSSYATVNTLPLEFIEYHYHIGIDHFIFYDHGLHPLLRYFIQNRALEAGFSVELLPWNMPYDLLHLSRRAYEMDCAYRNLNGASYFVRLGVNQFVVLQDTSIKEFILYDFHGKQKSYLKVKLFCSEFESDIVAKTLGFPFETLRKTRFIDGTNEAEFLTSPEMVLALKSNASKYLFPKGALHVYDKCKKSEKDNVPTSYQLSTSMLKWKKLFFESALYQSYIYDVKYHSQ